MAYKFNFFTKGSEAPEYTYIFSFLAIVFLFILSFLGISLMTGNVLFGAIGGVAMSVILYILVKQLEMIKIGEKDSSAFPIWLLFIAILLFSLTTSYHYLHNYMSNTNSGNDTYLAQKAKEMRNTADLYTQKTMVLEEMKTCEHGILNIDDLIMDAKQKNDLYMQLAAEIKNPLKIINATEPLGLTFGHTKDEIIEELVTNKGECESPSIAFNLIDYSVDSKDYGLFSSINNLMLGVFIPLLIIIPLMLLLPFFMAQSRNYTLKPNPNHPRFKK